MNNNISEYFHLVLADNWKFPDFYDKCPICGGKKCPVRIGYYFRFVYDFDSKKLFLLPIARYKCRRTNKNFKDKKAHKTFSLLPSSIIPYHKYDVKSLLFAVEKVKINKLSLLDSSLELVVFFDPIDIGFGTSGVSKYLKIFEAACVKLSYYKSDPCFNKCSFAISFFKKQVLNQYCYDFFRDFNKFLFGIPSHER